MKLRPVEEARPVDLTPLGAYRQRVAEAHGGRGWLALEAGRAWGYVLTAPLPGMPGLHEIEFYVVPARRRQGVGSRLWAEARAALVGEPAVRRVSAALDEQSSPLAGFLAALGFRPEHEEWQMRRDRLEELGAPEWPAGYEPASLSRSEAIQQFIAVYDASFGPTPWYQPFSRGEVAQSLESASDLLFAVNGGEPVGVAWMRLEEGRGVIEPIGIVPGHQGRGAGRALLVTALYALSQRGARDAHLGVWRENRAAIALYQQLGFRYSGRKLYLAYDLDASPVSRRLR